MMHIIIVNDKEFSAYDWTEAVFVPSDGHTPPMRHARGPELLAEGVSELAPGEVAFRADLTFAFDTPFTLKGDGRMFVVVAGQDGWHVAKPF